MCLYCVHLMAMLEQQFGLSTNKHVKEYYNQFSNMDCMYNV